MFCRGILKLFVSETDDDSGTSIIRCFIAEPTEKIRVWDRVPRLTAGSVKVAYPAAEGEDVALLMVGWQQNVPAA